MPMTPQLLHILQHSLGVDQYGRGNQYRNHFVTGPGSTDFPLCQELVNLGLMADRGVQSMMGGSHCFVVTEDGRGVVQMLSPKAPKLTPGQERYRQFLRSDTGIPFIKWLRARSATCRKGAL
jgi:hypothetical protein